MSASLDAEQDAKYVIEQLRIKHSTVAHEELATIVGDLLDLTASELYDASTHFLLEMLQNADDNEYNKSTSPTLTLTYEAGSLRVDCNEVGFEKKHVEAISRVRRSTKSGKNQLYKYTGEKGIGFKSVFRVADKVWISSRQYHFKFDRTKKFGMIAPEWAEFPRRTYPGVTSFYLELSPHFNADELVQDLRNFAPTNLIFLQQIEKVVIREVDKYGVAKWENEILKIKTQNDGESFTVLDMGYCKLRYLNLRHRVHNLPLEPKRAHYSHSELTLAFPVIEPTTQPLPGTQFVYTLLPISDHGLKFLLNADFLLTANRLHIDVSSLWNKTMRDGLADAFIQAVHNFKNGSMKYQWPYFIPPESVSPFLQPARQAILDRLREDVVLESSAGMLSKPPSLTYADPYKYADEEGRPFTLCSETEKKYLSTNFPLWTINPILELGVRELSNDMFLEHLESMISTDPAYVHAKPREWHSQLAKALIPMTQQPSLVDTLSSLCIIPLLGGGWTSAEKEPVLFSKKLDATQFPVSYDMPVVDPEATADGNRRRLFERLDIIEVDGPRMCRRIVDAHASSSFKPDELKPTELISHAVFLFESSWQPLKGVDVDIWFATSDGGRRKGSQLYIRGDFLEGSPTANVFDKLRERFATVHEDYLLTPQLEFPESWPSEATKSFRNYQGTPRVRRFDVRSHQTRNSSKDISSDSPVLYRSQHASGRAQHNTSLKHNLDRNAWLIEESEELGLERNSMSVVHDSLGGTLTLLKSLDSFTAEQRHPSYLQVIDDAYLSHSRTQVGDPWRVYLVKSLHLSEIPRLVSFPTCFSKAIYHLSEEFKYILQECPITDVLHLLHIHWKSYSYWLELDISKKHDADRIRSNKNLIRDIGDSIVRIPRGQSPLRETVLPMLDSRVHELNIPIAALGIKDCKDSVMRGRLAFLGIGVERNVRYYIHCLESFRQQSGSPDHEAISYVYHQIQKQYDDNEEMIDEIFQTNALIYLGARASKKNGEARWVNVQQCARRNIDLELRYPEAQELFNGLLDPGAVEVEPLVERATLIDRSWKLQRILDLLIEISAQLQGSYSSKVRISVRPLWNKKIFPVSETPKQDSNYKLLSRKDTMWFIADRPQLVDSFSDKVPLLALPAQQVDAISNLLGALQLDARRLSRLTRRNAYPSGISKPLHQDTKFLRNRAKFIKMLIPQSKACRDITSQQMDNISVRIVPNIYQVYISGFKENLPLDGNPIPCDVTHSYKEGKDRLRIFVTVEGLISRGKSMGVINIIGTHCGISDRNHLSLLYVALTDSKLARVQHCFQEEGFHFDASTESTDDSSDSELDGYYKFRSGDIMKVPSPFANLDDDNHPNSSMKCLQFGCSCGGARESEHSPDRTRTEPDRRIPMMHIVNSREAQSDGAIYPHGVFYRGWGLDPNRHLEFLGQHMISLFLTIHMGGFYDPSRHWTSDLRARVGLPSYDIDENGETAPFTITDFRAVKALQNFLIGIGCKTHSQWRGCAPHYHLEIAASGGDTNSTFIWSSSQFRRVQKLYHSTPLDSKPNNIMILVSITDVYSNPQFQFICSPWRLIESNRLIIENGTKIRVSIDLEPSSSLENRDISPDPKGPVPTSPKTQICPAPVQMTISPPDHDGAYPHLSYNILVSGQIRLLLLLPGDTHHTLRGSIYTCRSIPSAGPYRALSYVWGKARHSNHILVTENGVLHLKASLYTALVQLRHRKSPIVLWVDAICINQRDQPEKEQQIRLMPKIFQNAACTIAILGRGDQYGDAMKTLLQIRAKDAFGSVLSKWPATLLPVPHSWQQRPIPHPKDVIWNKIRQFFEQDWFRRAWIVQEAAVAPVLRIVCGTWTVDWADIYGAVLIVKRDQQFSNSMATSWGPFESLNDLRGWEARKSRWNLLTLLETFRHVGSTLKRDRFFALVGLASDGDKKEFDPECGRDVPFEHIACRFGRAFIAQGHGMQLLYQAGLGSQPDRFPSWLPDLTIPRPGGLGDVEADFNASKNRENQIRCLNENMVAVLGCLVDEIQELSESRNEPADGEQIHYFRDIDGMVGSLAGTYKPERLKELKWQVPVAGAIDPEIATMRGLELSESYESFREWLTKLEIKLKKGSKSLSHIDILSSDDANTGGEKPLTRRQKARVYSSILAGFKGWRFVTTKRRLCGIVPENAKKGDILTIFGGGNVPFLLRKSDSKPGAYRLVGACYINGIMDGESFSFQDVKQGTFEIH